ncbi:histamine N-methyltransferase-like isoform X2 [Acanthaster planci]|nr:histamine N-methyltransferase-like isoform X2 [Acanthaster planci]XP_022103966.1 histamine N-methyltransferase-like isoform X2 [Acanthaster planci]
MQSTWQNLFHDTDHYLQSLKTFGAACGEFAVYVQWMETIIQETVVPKLKGALDQQGDLRVMGVGSGSGLMDYKLLVTLLQQFPRITNCVLEPLEEQLMKYHSLIESQALEQRGVNFEWRQQTIEQYEKAGSSAKFHFIIAMHVLYYFDNLEDSLMYLYSILKPGGIIMVVISSDDSGTSRFRSHMGPYHETYSVTSSADVRNVLDHHGISYSQHHERFHVNITSCFDDASEEGSMVLDFLNHVTKFKESATEDLKQQVLERLASSECSETTGDEILLNNDCDTIIISKPR